MTVADEAGPRQAMEPSLESGPPAVSPAIPAGHRDWQFLWIAAAVSIAAFAASWWSVSWLLHNGFYGHVIVTDVPVYRHFAEAMAGGNLPYRDFPLVYPPGSLPVFLIPAIGLPPTAGDAAYGVNFEALMLLCGAVATIFVLLTLWKLDVGRGRLAVAVGFMALSPLLIGPVILSHFDLWPAALTAAGVAAFVWGRRRLGSGILGLAVIAKVYPIVVLPLVVASAWRRFGLREAVACAGIALGVGLLVLLPFAIMAPGGVIQPVVDQLSRPLQVESLGAAILIVLHGLTGLGVTVVSSFGSQNLAGPLPNAVAVVQSFALAAALVGIWLWFLRGPADDGRLLVASAAAVAAFAAFGKVLSPQYLIWLIPPVAVVPGRRGLVAIATLAVALLLTAAYFPRHYLDLVRAFDPGTAWTVFLRDAALVVLVSVLTLSWTGIRTRAGAAYRAIDRRFPLAELVPGPGATLVLVLVAAFLLRALWLSLPAGSLIFDENYYVNAARVMVGIHPVAGAPYATAPLFLDPNTEHPPLGKALIGASILLFGDNGLGWRIPSLIAGMVALIALYGIVRALGGRPWMAVLATTIYALDVLSFIHGRIGTLDMMSLAFLMAGAWSGLTGRWAPAGAAFALGTLVKVPGVYGLLAAVAWQAIGLWGAYRRDGRIGWPEIRPTVTLVGVYAVIGLAGLWLLDLRFTTFASPFDHIRRMLGYGFALQPTYSPNSITSTPLDWLTNGGQFDYLKVAVNTLVNGQVTGSRPIVEFRALMNPVLVGSAVLAVLYGGWLAWRRSDAVARWSLVWMGANFLPYIALSALSNRITYFYYVLPTIPGLAAITAAFLVRSRLPRVVVWGYLVASIVAFVVYFPFRQIP